MCDGVLSCRLVGIEEDETVLDARLSNLQDVTKYSPIRVAMAGIRRVIFGMLLAVPGVAFVWLGPNGEPGATRAPGDMPAWWMFVVGLAFSFAAFCFITGGVGRIISAFMRDCYFRAGTEGMAIRVPKQGWFGRFKVMEYPYKWEEVERIINITRSVNFIPIGSELNIRVYGGKEITIERYYFSSSAKKLCADFLAARARAGK